MSNTTHNLIPRVDPQHIHLDALEEAYGQALENFIECGIMDESEARDHADYTYERMPESVVFTGDYLDEAYGGDWEEAMEVVQMVGGRDLDAKIRHMERALDSLRDYTA